MWWALPAVYARTSRRTEISRVQPYESPRVSQRLQELGEWKPWHARVSSRRKFASEQLGLVRETRQSHDSEWSAITSVAEKMGCTPETLRKWMRQSQRDVGERAGLTTEPPVGAQNVTG